MSDGSTFSLKVVTPDQVFFEGQSVSVVAPGEMGYFGVLRDHAPFISTLGKGNLTTRDEAGKTTSFRIEGGFFEVNNNKVLVLTDKVEAAAA